MWDRVRQNFIDPCAQGFLTWSCRVRCFFLTLTLCYLFDWLCMFSCFTSGNYYTFIFLTNYVRLVVFCLVMYYQLFSIWLCTMSGFLTGMQGCRVSGFLSGYARLVVFYLVMYHQLFSIWLWLCIISCFPTIHVRAQLFLVCSLLMYDICIGHFFMDAYFFLTKNLSQIGIILGCLTYPFNFLGKKNIGNSSKSIILQKGKNCLSFIVY